MAGAGWSNQEKRDGNLGRKILLLLTIFWVRWTDHSPKSSSLLIYETNILI